MKIVFVSNYMNHHQLPLSKYLSEYENVEYWFIATKPIRSERLALGYKDLNSEFPFVIRAYEGEAERTQSIELCNNADMVIYGSAPYSFIENRVKKGKLTFIYSERIYKLEPPKIQMPLRTIKNYLKYGRHDNVFLLCASAFTAYDYARTLTFVNKAFKWGYFPQTVHYDNISLLVEKKKNIILWVGRMIDWKHPEIPIMVAEHLKVKGYAFDLRIIGTGAMKQELEKKVVENELESYVTFLGSMSPKEVRRNMEEASIFLFTSDRQEGWGAVLNEAMNSGCAVVANHEIGSVPFLIDNGSNGLIYESGNYEMLFQHVEFLMNNPEQKKNMGINAYESITTIWNARNAANNLILLTRNLLGEELGYNCYEGPGSKAEIIQDKWDNRKCGDI